MALDGATAVWGNKLVIAAADVARHRRAGPRKYFFRRALFLRDLACRESYRCAAVKKAAVASAPLSRPPLERMMRIHQAIQSGKFPNATSLAAELEVSTKSIHRDIEFMRDRMLLPIEFNPQGNGYHYTEEVNAFPTLQITEGELFALLVAEKALQQYRGTTFEKPLLSAFRKMAATLPDTISLNLADWEQTISFRTSAEPLLNLQIFDALAKATAKREQLKLEYRKPARRATETRIVDPYHLANINGEWFLFAHCHLRRDIRTFVPARIQSLTPTGKTFVRPQKFSLEKRLRDSFGVHSGQGEFEVVIRFDDLVADYIREKRWHPSQVLRELPGGGIELKLRLSSLVEIQRWVLGWGGNAVVVQPPELARSVRAAAENVVRNSKARPA
jgi:predicted DNA-binding transcriptional regulator YafY